MTYPIAEPTPQGEQQAGDRLAPRDIVNRPMILRPMDYRTGIKTEYQDAADGILVNIALLSPDGSGEEHYDLLWFQGRIIGAFKGQIGQTFAGQIVTAPAPRGTAFEFQSMSTNQNFMAAVQSWLGRNPQFMARQPATPGSPPAAASPPAAGWGPPVPAETRPAPDWSQPPAAPPQPAAPPSQQQWAPTEPQQAPPAQQWGAQPQMGARPAGPPQGQEALSNESVLDRLKRQQGSWDGQPPPADPYAQQPPF